MGRLTLLLATLTLLGTVLSCSSFDTETALKTWLLNFSLETVPSDPPEGPSPCPSSA
ncbi:MAG TPA: hypothetical protein PL180_05720 [Spirochaetota bacterium]|nr:hypothetical protein [Spirochaetota bacterium]HPL16166.1 hypothetical protein [Spirochaetota bacterium]HQJ69416.1 hypothetical protein [Spirochaetota bacterium]HRS76015.1 hypothetical protein [Spirochaetota bacterium]HRT73679.1 hypothetical protein [Spirochaetota bacterium]